MELSAKKPREGKRDYVRVARTLRDKLDGLIASGATDLRTQRKLLLDASKELDLALANEEATHRYDEISTCRHSCSEHEQVLNPVLWSTLPLELLQCVFAKLPIPDICRLKSLSKEWQLSLQSSSSQFTLALKESSPRMLARVTWGGHSNFGLHVLDERNNRWYESHVYAADGAEYRRPVVSKVYQWVHLNGSADAGLVCYIDKMQIGLNCTFVMNPMTGVVNQLLACSLSLSKLSMMRIIVDRDTYHYKVILVRCDSLVEAEVYDSEVQRWTKPKPSLGRIFGIAHDWNWHEDFWSAYKLGPCAYDCRDGKYYNFEQDQEKWLADEVISYTLMEDRLFVLYWDEREDAAFISQYSVPENATSWVKEKTHSCFPRVFWQPHVHEQICRIHACSGFLFVFILKQEDGWIFDDNPPTKHENGWIYDLGTSEWRALPRVPWWSTIHFDSFMTNEMCELHWNIQP